MSPSPQKQDNLSGAIKIVIVVMIVCLGLWGCARKPANRAEDSERVRALEARCQKLEQDLRTMTQARDKARTELSSLEDGMQKEVASLSEVTRERDALRNQLKTSQAERQQMHKTLVQRTGERDDLRQQLTQRVNERDAVMSRCEKLRKSLQQVLSQDDNPASNIPTASPVSPNPGPSFGTQG